MKIYRSAVTSARPLEVDEEVSFRDKDFSPFYPLLGIERCHLQGEITKEGKLLWMRAYVTADLKLVDARSNEAFYLPVTHEEYFPLLEDEEGDIEGYVFPNNLIEASDIAFALLRTLVPIKPLKEGSELPKGGDGYSFYLEDDAPSAPSPFDCLEGLEE